MISFLTKNIANHKNVYIYLSKKVYKKNVLIFFLI